MVEVAMVEVAMVEAAMVEVAMVEATMVEVAIVEELRQSVTQKYYERKKKSYPRPYCLGISPLGCW